MIEQSVIVAEGSESAGPAMLIQEMMETVSTPQFHATERVEDRILAGRQLAALLQPYRTSRALVLGLPPGGVVVACGVAQALRLPLDVLIAREFALQPYPTLGAGALSEGGGLCLNASVLRLPGVRLTNMWKEARRTYQELSTLTNAYRSGQPVSAIERRYIILVDDGMSNGLLQLAALAALRRAHARQCIIATPGGNEAALQRVAQAADLLIPAVDPRLHVPLHWQHSLDDDEAAFILHWHQYMMGSPAKPLESKNEIYNTYSADSSRE